MLMLKLISLVSLEKVEIIQMLLYVLLFICLIVYLRSDPEVVHKRILQRARKEEKTVPLSYIVALHEIHEDWYYFYS